MAPPSPATVQETPPLALPVEQQGASANDEPNVLGATGSSKTAERARRAVEMRARAIMVGAEVQALSTRADGSGMELHRTGDFGRVSVAPHADRAGVAVFNVIWERTGSTTTEFVDDWQACLRLVDQSASDPVALSLADESTSEPSNETKTDEATADACELHRGPVVEPLEFKRRLSGSEISISLCSLSSGQAHSAGRNLDLRIMINGRPEGAVPGGGTKVTTAEKGDATSVAPSFSLPLLVRTVGAILACSAGLVNSVAFFELGAFVSHQTGSLSKVGFGDTEALGLVLSFLGGSVACGLIIGKDTIHIGLEPYDLGLLGIAALLVFTTLSHHEPQAKYLAAAACGLQNSMATFWGGAVVRTTHVTGLFTDLGLLIGRLGAFFVRSCRFGQKLGPADRAEVTDSLRKGSFLGTLALSFMLGVVIGMHVHGYIHEYAFLLPAGVVGFLGVAYMFNRVVILKQRLLSAPEECTETAAATSDQVEASADSVDHVLSSCSGTKRSSSDAPPLSV